jgi:hypothetical protein
MPALFNLQCNNNLFYFQRGFSSRVKAIHVINVGAYLDATVNMVKSLLKPKMAARVSYTSSCQY